jgi:hypothetical protein
MSHDTAVEITLEEFLAYKGIITDGLTVGALSSRGTLATWKECWPWRIHTKFIFDEEEIFTVSSGRNMIQIIKLINF